MHEVREVRVVFLFAELFVGLELFFHNQSVPKHILPDVFNRFVMTNSSVNNSCTDKLFWVFFMCLLSEQSATWTCIIHVLCKHFKDALKFLEGSIYMSVARVLA